MEKNPTNRYMWSKVSIVKLYVKSIDCVVCGLKAIHSFIQDAGIIDLLKTGNLIPTTSIIQRLLMFSYLWSDRRNDSTQFQVLVLEH